MGVLVIRSLGMSMFGILGVKLMGMLMLVVVFLFMAVSVGMGVVVGMRVNMAMFMGMPGSVGMLVLMHMAVQVLVLMIVGLALGVLMAVQVNVYFVLGHASAIRTHESLHFFVSDKLYRTLRGCNQTIYLHRYHNPKTHCQHGTKKEFMSLCSNIFQLHIRTVTLVP